MTGKLIAVWAAAAVLIGCAETMYKQREQTWNAWIGSTKDDRVKGQGIPTRCHSFKSGGEACEWPVTWAPSETGTITISFDGNGKACQWIYKDAYSERRSTHQCP
jgi:hypothetical protein